MIEPQARNIAQAGGKADGPSGVFRIVLVYAVFAALWILLSDRAVELLFETPAQITRASTYKGWLFVTVTSLLLYGLMKRMVDNILGASLRERKTQAEKLQTLQLLRESEFNYRLLTEQVPAIIYRAALDQESKPIYVSPQVAALGYPAEDWLSKPGIWLDLMHPDDREVVLRELEISQRSGENFLAEYRLKTQGGEWRAFRDEARVIRDDQGRGLYIQGVMLDITERRQAEADLHRLAYYDSLTGLPNRTLLMDRLGQMLTMSKREKRLGALIFLNIDRLKTLNDARGHVAGDALLKAVSERLSNILREDDTLARLAGDEFAVLLHGFARDFQGAGHHAHIVAEKIHNVLKQPFSSGEDELIITASLGVTLFPEAELDEPNEILRRADTAMHRAKKNGGNQTAFFEIDMGELASQRFQTERELRHAIPAGELRLYLQPQVNAQGEMVGAEALVRWQHPLRGLVLPGAFVPFAEESDLIVELDAWVLGEVCRLLSRPEMADRAMRIAVNVSPRHFRRPGFVQSVKNLLAATGADPSHLTLEVTEGLMIDNLNEMIAKMTELAALGIHFSVDDFGTGYSSLAYLKRLPIHELKIDKTFVQDAPNDPDDAALVEVILSVAKHLHLKIVAEGVETREQADFLNARAKVIHQGYLYGKPEPSEIWLERHMYFHDAAADDAGKHD